MTGVDISVQALRLARENLAIKLENCSTPDHSGRTESLRSLRLLQADVLHDQSQAAGFIPSVLHALCEATHSAPVFDLLISNPPYISHSTFARTAARSVQHFEPRLALVPPSTGATGDKGDRFYLPLLRLAEQVKAKIVLFEVADLEQAKRVVQIALQHHLWAGCMEIWRDEPRAEEQGIVTVEGQNFKTFGRGEGRSVLLCKDEGAQWIKWSRGLSHSRSMRSTHMLWQVKLRGK